MRVPLLLIGLLLSAPLFADFKLPTLPKDLDKALGIAKDVKGAVSDPDFEEERGIGQSVAATLLGAAKPVNDAKLQQYVNRVGLWVALQSGRASIPWRFAVLDNANINAFAAPGGYVFVTRGLMDQLHSEAELAGVLGHEIAHVTRKHHLKAMKKESGMNLLGHIAPMVGGKADMQQLGKLATVTKNLYSRGLDKDDEFEADRAGVILAARAGYDAFGLVQVLQTLDGLNASSSQLALLFKTHPAPAARLEQLEQQLGAKLVKVGAQPDLAERFASSTRR